MYAINSNMQRDIVFDDAQNGDPMKRGLENSMDISINGNGQRPSKENIWIDGGADDVGIENMVDNARFLNSKTTLSTTKTTQGLLSSSIWGTT
jgi:hypothetical protein